MVRVHQGALRKNPCRNCTYGKGSEIQKPLARPPVRFRVRFRVRFHSQEGLFHPTRSTCLVEQPEEFLVHGHRRKTPYAAPVATNCFAEPRATQVAVEDVVAHFIRFTPVGVLREPHRIDVRDLGPQPLGGRLAGDDSLKDAKQQASVQKVGQKLAETIRKLVS